MPRTTRAGAVEDRTTLGTHDLSQAGRIATLFFAEIGRLDTHTIALVLLIAQPAVERAADPAFPALGVEHPGPFEEGRLVTYVLAVAALEQRDPVTDIVLGELHDGALHEVQVRACRYLRPLDNSIVSRYDRVTMRLTDADYEDLLTLRSGLRRFLRWSEQQAEEAGLTAAQHELLLAIRGHTDPRGPTVGEIADYLLLRHHSAVGLVDRADAAGLVVRSRDKHDHRVVRLSLSPAGRKRLESLSKLHLDELQRLAQKLPNAWRGLMPRQPLHGLGGTP